MTIQNKFPRWLLLFSLLYAPMLCHADEQDDGDVISAGDDDLDQNEILKNQVRRLNGKLEELERELTLLRKNNGAQKQKSDGLTEETETNDVRATDPSMGDDPDAVNAMPTTVQDDAQVDAILDSLLEKDNSLGDEKDSEGDDSGTKTKNNPKKVLEEKREKATEEAEKKAPKNLEVGDEMAQYNAAQSFYKQGEFIQAERAFADYVQRFPKTKMAKSAKFWLAKSKLDVADPASNKGISTPNKKKASEAFKAFADYYKEHPKDEKVPQVLVGMGKAFALQGEKKKACVPLKKLKADFPKDKESNASADKLMKSYGCGK